MPGDWKTPQQPPGGQVFAAQPLRMATMNKITILFLLGSLLFYSCLPSLPAAHETQTFKKGEQLIAKHQQKLSLLQQEYSDLEKQERQFLLQLDLNQAQSYANYKNSFNQPQFDQVKAIIYKRQMIETFNLSPHGKTLLPTALKLAHQISKISSDIENQNNYLRDISRTLEEYLNNYPR